MDEEDRLNAHDEKVWRRRFVMVNLTTIAGTILVLFSLLLWQTDYIVPGGSVLGFPLALVGLVISFFAPRVMAKRWKQMDRR
jgi:uncharacterized membrane protein YhaH (DUF805 family)